jgi:hypothetical protein
MTKWLSDNVMLFHYIGTVAGLIINMCIGIAIYRKHIRTYSKKDMKIDLMWSKFVKDNKLNGTDVEE